MPAGVGYAQPVMPNPPQGGGLQGAPWQNFFDQLAQRRMRQARPPGQMGGPLDQRPMRPRGPRLGQMGGPLDQRMGFHRQGRRRPMPTFPQFPNQPSAQITPGGGPMPPVPTPGVPELGPMGPNMPGRGDFPRPSLPGGPPPRSPFIV